MGAGATWRWLLAALIFAASALGAAMTPAPAQAALLDYDAVPCNDVDRLLGLGEIQRGKLPMQARCGGVVCASGFFGRSKSTEVYAFP